MHMFGPSRDGRYFLERDAINHVSAGRRASQGIVDSSERVIFLKAKAAISNPCAAPPLTMAVSCPDLSGKRSP
jgi:hypothetical protein